MAATMTHTAVFNFVLCGGLRAGTGIVQAAIAGLPGVACHQNLLHADEAVRKAEHEQYFGSDDALSEWYKPDTSPWQYLNHQVFDCPQHDERIVGVRIPYDRMHALELYDLLHARCLEGDFGIVHVVRNPVACYVSQQQALRTGIWSQPISQAASANFPAPLDIRPDHLTEYVRRHNAVRGKVEQACDDVLVVQYVDLLREFQATMAKVLDFIEVPPQARIPSMCRRLRNRDMRQRIANYDTLLCKLPWDVRQELVAEDCV